MLADVRVFAGDASLTHELLCHIIGCVHQCLLHDTDASLVTADVFNLIMQPLLDQVSLSDYVTEVIGL